MTDLDTDFIRSKNLADDQVREALKANGPTRSFEQVDAARNSVTTFGLFDDGDGNKFSDVVSEEPLDVKIEPMKIADDAQAAEEAEKRDLEPDTVRGDDKGRFFASDAEGNEFIIGRRLRASELPQTVGEQDVRGERTDVIEAEGAPGLAEEQFQQLTPQQRFRSTARGEGRGGALPTEPPDVAAAGERAVDFGLTVAENVFGAMVDLDRGINLGLLETANMLGFIDDADQEEFTKRLPPASATPVGAIAEFGGRVIGPGAPIFKALQAAGIGVVTAGILADGLGSALGLDPDDPNLAALIPEGREDEIAGQIRDILATDPDDPEFANRARNFVENLGIGAAFVGTLKAVAKIARIKPDDVRGLLERAGIRAEERMRERRGTTAMLTAGIDVTPLGDPIIAAMGRVATRTGAERAPVYVSQAEQAVANAKFDKGTARQWLALPGLKKEEIEFTGLDSFLAGKQGSIGKDEVLKHLDENGLQVREVVNEQSFDTLTDEVNRETKFSTYTLPGGENYRELLVMLPENQNAAAAARSARVKELITRRDELQAQLPTGDATGTATTELRRQIANTEVQIDLAMRSTDDPSAFVGGHFDEPNVLAHIRFNERVDADGKRVLFIEEIQSDWHQKGRRAGYQGSGSTIDEQIDAAQEELARRAGLGEDADAAAWQRARDDHPDLGTRIDALLQQRPSGGAVPDAPFKKTWHELAFKRALRWAADNDFDSVAWTTGRQQAERYDLSKHIKTLTVDAFGEGPSRAYTINFQTHAGEQQGFGAKSADQLADAIGKDMAEKITSNPDKRQIYEGLDLRVGGEGMAAFYDRMLPNVANRLGKKFGARAGTAELGNNNFSIVDDSGELTTASTRELAEEAQERFTGIAGSPVRIVESTLPVHALDLTAEFKDAVVRQGLPLFSAGGAAAGLTVAADPSVPEIFLGEPFVDQEVQVAGAGGAILRGLGRARRARPPAAPLAAQRQFIAGRAIADPSAGPITIRPATEGEGRAFLGNVGLEDAAKGVDFNFTNINSTDELKQTINQISDMVAPRIDEAKRGVVSRKVTAETAEQLDMLPRVLERKRGETFNAEEIVAARILLADSAKRLDELAVAAASADASELTMLAFRRQMALHAAIQMQIKGAQTEIARALGSFNIPVGPEGRLDEAMLSTVLDEFGGFKSTRNMARRYLEVADPIQRNKLAFGGWAAKTQAAFFEVWINGLLSGPFTHVRNTVGNSMFQAWSIPEHGIAAALGAARDVGGRTLGRGPVTDRVFAVDVMARAYGTIEGFRDGLSLFAQAMRTGEPIDRLSKIEMQSLRAISADTFGLTGNTGKAVDLLGNMTRLPGRFLTAEDEFFKGLAARMEINQLAARAAKVAELNGATADEAADVAMEILRNPPPDIIKSVDDAARYYTFTDEPLGRVNEALVAIQKIPMVGRIIMPFRRTPLQIMKKFGERSVFAAVMPSVWRNLRAGGIQRDMALARITMGSLVVGVAASMTADGLLSGKGPRDPVRRRQLRETGWQPWSIKVPKGGGWVDQATLATLKAIGAVSEGKDSIYISYLGIEPIGNMLAVASGTVDALRWSDDFNRNEDLATVAVAAAAESMSDRSFMTGFANLSDAFKFGPKAFNRYISNLAASMKPFSAILRQINRMSDRNLKDVRVDPDLPIGVSQFWAFRNGWVKDTPGLSDLVPNVRNLWGDEVKLGEGNWFEKVNPFYISPAKYAPVDREMVRLGSPVRVPKDRIGSVRLSAEQHQRLIELQGKAVILDGQTQKEAMDRAINGSGYRDAALPDDERVRILRNIHADYLNEAKRQLAGYNVTRLGGRAFPSVDLSAAEDAELAIKLERAIQAERDLPRKELPPF